MPSWPVFNKSRSPGRKTGISDKCSENLLRRPRLFLFRDCEVGKASLGKHQMLPGALAFMLPPTFWELRSKPVFSAPYNCPAAFKSAANEASDITSVKGLPLKGTAP